MPLYQIVCFWKSFHLRKQQFVFMLSSGPPTVLPSYFLIAEKPAHLDQFNKISMDYKQYFYIKRHFFNYAVAMRGTMQEKQGNNFDSIKCYFPQYN
jgi:hypothetical protein